MKKSDLDKQISIKRDLENGIVCGIKVKFVPQPGMGVLRRCGSDSHGFIIDKVFENGKIFTYGRVYQSPNGDKNWVESGRGILVTRKNSPAYGTYREALLINGKFRPMVVKRFTRWQTFYSLHLTGEFKQPDDYENPSF